MYAIRSYYAIGTRRLGGIQVVSDQIDKLTTADLILEPSNVLLMFVGKIGPDRLGLIK